MQVTIQKCGNGVNKDLLPSELLPSQWSDALNIRFRNDFAEKFRGIKAAYTTPTAAPYWIGTYETTAGRYLVQAGLSAVFVDDGTTRTDITGAVPTGAIDDRWTGGVLNGVLIMNNGANDATFWNGNIVTDLATLTGWTVGWRSDVMRPFKNYLVCLGNTRGGAKKPHNVGWSNAAEPGAIPTTFTAAAANDAGDQDLAETTGVMVDCLPLGDANIIYKQDARYAMNHIGGTFVFRFQRLPGNDGLLARGCVVNTPKGHVFLSNGDVKIHSGGEAVSLAEGRIRKWLFRTMDAANAKRSFLALNPQKTEVWVCFPSYGQAACDMAAVWNWESDTWGIRAISAVTYGTTGLIAANLAADTWVSDTDPWSTDGTTWTENEFNQNDARMIVSTSTPRIGLVDTGTTDFGTVFSWRLEKTGIQLDDPESIKILSASRPQFSALAGTAVSVYHGSAMTADATPTYASAATHTVGTTNWSNAFATGGRYMALKLESSAAQPVALRSYDLDYTKMGRF